MRTKTKIALAGLAYRAVRLVRSAVSLPDKIQVGRRGVTWALDLNEGIDFSIFLLGSFEPSTVGTLQYLVRPGDVVLDIGANVGSHTLRLAQFVGTAGRVYAFEPTDYAFQKLQKNLTLNPLLAARVTAEQIMLM